MKLYDASKIVRDNGISAARAMTLDVEYKVLTKKSFLESCAAALRNWRRRGVGKHRGNESLDCNKLAFMVYAELLRFHAINFSGDAAPAVGLLPYRDDEVGQHMIVFAVMRNKSLCFYDPTREKQVELSEDEKSMALTYVM